MAVKFDQFTVKSQEAIQRAQSLAIDNKHADLEPLHLLLALLDDEGVATALLEKIGVAISQFQRQIRAELSQKQQVSGDSQPNPTRQFIAVLEASQIEAAGMKDEFTSIEHVLLALTKTDSSAKNLMQVNGVRDKDILEVLKSVRGAARIPDQNSEGHYEALQKYGVDLVQKTLSGKLDPVIGRDQETRRVIEILGRRTKNSAVLIGQPGVGKTAIVRGLALRIVQGDIPQSLKNRRIVAIDMGRLLIGAQYRGGLEERLNAVIREVQQSRGQIILFIDELHTIVGAGRTEGVVDAANLLRPALASGDVRCIAAARLDEYRKYLEKDAGIDAVFSPVLVAEPTVRDTIGILRGLKPRYEAHHGVRIKDSALVAGATLAQRYVTDRFLPDKALELVDAATSRLATELETVPTEIDDVQRRLWQLELASRQLAEETEAVALLEEIEAEISEMKRKLASLREQWETEKLGVGDVQKLRTDIDRVNLEYSQLEEQIKRRQSSGIAPSEDDYQKLYKLYNQRLSLQKRIDQSEELGERTFEHPLLRQEVTEFEIAEVVSSWTGIPTGRIREAMKAEVCAPGDSSQVQDVVTAAQDMIGKIFLSYRRQDAPHVAGRIYDHLLHYFHVDDVFKDVDNIPVGVNYKTVIDQRIAESSVILVIIGHNWTGPGNQSSRLMQLNDPVRLEVESALGLGKRIVPVLVDDASMPETEHVPESLHQILYFNALRVRPDPDFRRDMDRLVKWLEPPSAPAEPRTSKRE